MTEDLKKRIAELENTVRQLEKDLIHDKLTGLKTRAYFEGEIRVYLDALNAVGKNRSRKKNWLGVDDVSVIFIDIDYFKEINDTFGHLAGDEALKSVARTILASVREMDTVARWAGDEIVVMLIGATESEALNKAQEIRRNVSNIHFGQFPELKVSVSCGVAAAHAGLILEDVLNRADKALYEAKRGGRNDAVAFSSIKIKD